MLVQNMLTKNKNFYAEIKSLNLELTEVKKEINEIKDRLLSVIKEVQGFAKKEEVEMLKKYIELWNPVRFVSKNDVDDIVRDFMDQYQKKPVTTEKI